MFACPSCGIADDESDIFFLKTLGEMPAQISLLAYVKPEQKKTLYTRAAAGVIKHLHCCRSECAN